MNITNSHYINGIFFSAIFFTQGEDNAIFLQKMNKNEFSHIISSTSLHFPQYVIFFFFK